MERSRRLSQRGGYSGNRHERKESERFKRFTYEELIKRDKLNLDIFWLKDAVTRVEERPGFPSLEDSANLPDPDVIAQEIVRFPSVWIDAYRRKRPNRAVRTKGKYEKEISAAFCSFVLSERNVGTGR